MKQFRADTDTTIEAVLSSGQKLQFGTRVAITVQRPDKMRAERVGELINQTFYYDGKTLSVHLPDQKYYATSRRRPRWRRCSTSHATSSASSRPGPT